MTCAKRHVTCTISARHFSWNEDGPSSRRDFYGSNDCEHPQAVCPRSPGEDYTKCRTICGQHEGHAEIRALAAARAAGVELKGAHATIRGHYYICEPCGAALRDAGVRSVTLEL